MKKEDIEQFFDIDNNPITYNRLRIDFIGGSYKIGFFVDDKEVKENNWRIVENNNSVKYRESNRDSKHTTIINGNEIEKITFL